MARGWIAWTVGGALLGMVAALAGAAPRALNLQPVRDVQEKGGIRVRRVDRSPEPAGAQVRIRPPADEAPILAGQDALLPVEVTGFELGVPTDHPRAAEVASARAGQHLRVVVDNEPCLEFADASKPLRLGRLDAGVHTVRVFAARSYHESVKSPGAFAIETIRVGTRGARIVHPRQPLLTWSRPAGEYAGRDAERILLDFYVTNATLSATGYKVRLTVDGHAFLLTEWTPYYLEGLAPGRHTLKLELLNPGNRPAAGAYNTSLRTITVRGG